ncbi:mucin-2-like, partial [Formica exsecta]|uniref:mucin-2-like n=1 Tax=Formica exsecta TaxID=72781 RepID=UPI001142106C
NNHWTSSPMVTQLWETTVFVDPQHINHGLQSSADIARSPTTDNTISEESERTAATTTRSPTLFTDVDIDGTTEERTTTSTPSPWQWATNGNDSPVTFTLLPTTFTVENTATPTPLITTRSSITTTITSSVTSTNSVPRDNLASTLLPFAANALNTTENEVIKAHEMFGKLNETSSNTLMRVMKQADNNETVRQLVLL